MRTISIWIRIWKLMEVKSSGGFWMGFNVLYFKSIFGFRILVRAFNKYIQFNNNKIMRLAIDKMLFTFTLVLLSSKHIPWYSGTVYTHEWCCDRLGVHQSTIIPARKPSFNWMIQHIYSNKITTHTHRGRENKHDIMNIFISILGQIKLFRFLWTWMSVSFIW